HGQVRLKPPGDVRGGSTLLSHTSQPPCARNTPDCLRWPPRAGGGGGQEPQPVAEVARRYASRVFGQPYPSSHSRSSCSTSPKGQRPPPVWSAGRWRAAGFPIL